MDDTNETELRAKYRQISQSSAEILYQDIIFLSRRGELHHLSDGLYKDLVHDASEVPIARAVIRERDDVDTDELNERYSNSDTDFIRAPQGRFSSSLVYKFYSRGHRSGLQTHSNSG